MTDAKATPLLPARMLNEYAYCPRLACLEWVQGEFAHSADTLHGAWKHRRVDRPGGTLPPPAATEAGGGIENEAGGGGHETGAGRIHARSVHLSSEEEGLTAVIDLVEGKGAAHASEVTPVDYKRGAAPDIPERAWEADRVQLCAQGLILAANGYDCQGGILYYGASRTRVGVPFDAELVTHTRALIGACRAMVENGPIPPPLAHSPKCPRCGSEGKEADGFDFAFAKRNRRPPEDPVNALLSFAYAILARDFTIACWAAGLDPYLGFYHQPRLGRPALALDLMEEFRPVIADSAVLTAVNTGVVRASDFVRRGNAVALDAGGRRGFLQAYERRMELQVTHPVFGYQISYRRVLEVQARLLGRVLLGEIEEYPSFLVR